MPARVHMHLSVSDLEASRAFYERFFGVPPVKEHDGYVKFLPAFAPLNVALSPGSSQARGEVNHAGVQLDSTAEVLEHLERVKATGLATRVAMATDCCP